MASESGLDALLAACHAHCPGVAGMPAVAGLMQTLAPHFARVGVRDGAYPWGRYLAGEGEGWNLQIDVFSGGYTGGVHKHDTWGLFWVIRGSLWTENFVGEHGETLVNAGQIPTGGGVCFCPPLSDWHRVHTPARGPQTLSFHLYGPGFDPDVGVGRGPDGRARRYNRGPWGDISTLRAALVEG